MSSAGSERSELHDRQKSTAERPDGSSGGNAAGCMAAWMRGCVAAWLHGCMAAWLRGCMAHPEPHAERSLLTVETHGRPPGDLIGSCGSDLEMKTC